MKEYTRRGFIENAAKIAAGSVGFGTGLSMGVMANEYEIRHLYDPRYELRGLNDDVLYLAHYVDLGGIGRPHLTIDVTDLHCGSEDPHSSDYGVMNTARMQTLMQSTNHLMHGLQAQYCIPDTRTAFRFIGDLVDSSSDGFPETSPDTFRTSIELLDAAESNNRVYVPGNHDECHSESKEIAERLANIGFLNIADFGFFQLDELMILGLPDYTMKPSVFSDPENVQMINSSAQEEQGHLSVILHNAGPCDNEIAPELVFPEGVHLKAGHSHGGHFNTNGLLSYLARNQIAKFIRTSPKYLSGIHRLPHGGMLEVSNGVGTHKAFRHIPRTAPCMVTATVYI